MQKCSPFTLTVVIWKDSQGFETEMRSSSVQAWTGETWKRHVTRRTRGRQVLTVMEPGRGMEADFCLGQATQVWRSAEGGDFSVKILRCHQEAWSLPGK